MAPFGAAFAAEAPEKAQPDPAVSTFPAGMVAFFAGPRCPQGWTDAPDAGGRVVVGASAPEESGTTAGEAFVQMEVPKHAHDFRASGRLDGPSMPTRALCCFVRDWVVPQDVAVEGATTEQDFGLPFFALRLCRQEVRQ